MDGRKWVQRQANSGRSKRNKSEGRGRPEARIYKNIIQNTQSDRKKGSTASNGRMEPPRFSRKESWRPTRAIQQSPPPFKPSGIDQEPGLGKTRSGSRPSPSKGSFQVGSDGSSAGHRPPPAAGLASFVKLTPMAPAACAEGTRGALNHTRRIYR